MAGKQGRTAKQGLFSKPKSSASSSGNAKVGTGVNVGRRYTTQSGRNDKRGGRFGGDLGSTGGDARIGVGQGSGNRSAAARKGWQTRKRGGK